MVFGYIVVAGEGYRRDHDCAVVGCVAEGGWQASRLMNFKKPVADGYVAQVLNNVDGESSGIGVNIWYLGRASVISV